MSGKDRLEQLKKLLKLDASDPSRGIQISLPREDAAHTHTHTHTQSQSQSQSQTQTQTQTQTHYANHPITITNGRIIREGRHADSEYKGWAYAIGPAEADLEKKIAAVARNSGPPIPLDSLEYAIVDTETTGMGVGRGHRITDIAIVRVNLRGEVLHEYSTLLNPGRSIPRMITELTHIDNRMVRTAPRFEDVAEDIRRLLEGRVFVAHNAGFDWMFVSGELARTTGRPLFGRKLCTVRLARKVVPEVRSRSLDSLSYYFGVPNEARHRALGDARATAIIFRRMMDRVREREIETWQQLEHMTLRRSQRRKRTAMPVPIQEI